MLVLAGRQGMGAHQLHSLTHLKFAAKAGLSSTPGACRVPSLEHEVLDDPVELEHGTISSMYA